jgi:glycosyltransferase 2 family protein
MLKAENRKRNSRVAMAAGVLLAIVLLYLAFRGVDWDEMLATLRQGSPGTLLLAGVIFTFSCLMRGLRWRVLLSAEKLLPPLLVFSANMIGYLGNNFLPARAGEVIRSVMVGQRGGISKSFALATALTERIMDAVLLVLISAVSLLALRTVPEWLLPALRVMAVAGVVGVGLVFVAPRMSGLADRLIGRLPLPERIREPLGRMMASFLLGTGALQNFSRLGQFLGFSALIWTLDMLTALTVGRAFGLELSPPLVLVLLAALGLSSALPSTPGYVGVYQFVAVNVLTPFGFARSEALVFILAYQALTVFVIAFFGLIGLWRLRR